MCALRCARSCSAISARISTARRHFFAVTLPPGGSVGSQGEACTGMTDVASRPGLDLSFTEEQQLVQRTAHEFAMNELLPHAADTDPEARFPVEAVKKLGELGFMGMMVPSEFGGAGLDAISYVLAMEEINRADDTVGVIMAVQ